MYRVGQRFMPGLVPLPSPGRASQTITPNYPGPYSFPRLPVRRPEPRFDIYGYQAWSGEGSQGVWTLLGTQILQIPYSQLDKLEAGCAILKQANLSGDPWVRGTLWHEGHWYNEYENRLSVALAYCSQFGF